MSETTIRLGAIEYPFIETLLPQATLKFFIENPRVYSCFDRSEREPTQEEVETVLCEMDGVKELKGAIESIGGLVHPLVVINDVVIEGNRRLAAYRILAKKDPARWAKARCMVLPSDLPEEAIFVLLGQYHLHGQLAWAPFELAGYLYRRIQKTNVRPEEIAKEVSKTPSEIRQYYKVYKFMVDNDDLDSKNWSYYEEYLKSQSIKKQRATLPELDKKVVKEIKAGNIKDARIDIREKLGTITKMPESVCNSTLQSFIDGEKTLNECFEEAKTNGVDILRDLINFRTWISKPETANVVRSLSKDDLEKYKFELEQIKGKVHRLTEIINQRKE